MNEAAIDLPALRAYIRTQMRSLGYRQKDLARLTRVTESYISQVLRGKTQPSTRFLHKLESAMELPRGRLSLLLGSPEMDLVRSFFPTQTEPDELSEITEEERGALIGYLRFLRMQKNIAAFLDSVGL